MDLVEEERHSLAVERDSVLGRRDEGSYIGDASHHGRDRRELRPDLSGQQPREARLSGAGRAPEDQRGEVAAGDAPTQRTALADQVVLAHELIERPRTHPRGEGLALGRWLEQRLGTGFLRSTWHRGQSRARVLPQPGVPPDLCAPAVKDALAAVVSWIGRE